ncbi:CmcJ/NvfI family oxidoreductase [Marinobacter sp. MBR-105]|jgi:hypothetical protein
MFSINYVQPVGGLEYDQRYKGPGASELTQSVDTRHIDVTDIRNQANDFNLDDQGFEAVRVAFDFDNYQNDDAIREHLYPQVIEYLRDQLKASEVLIFDHTYRSTSRQDQTIHNRAPVKTVHNDYTEKSALHRMLEETEQRPELRDRPYRLVNLWMPVGHRVEESPLAVLDINTVAADDFHRIKLVYPDRIGEIAGISYNPDHRWYYLSDMEPGEALLLKVFDSRSPAGIFGTPHTAADPVNTPDNARNRNSLEVRVIAFS